MIVKEKVMVLHSCSQYNEADNTALIHIFSTLEYFHTHAGARNWFIFKLYLFQVLGTFRGRFTILNLVSVSFSKLRGHKKKISGWKGWSVFFFTKERIFVNAKCCVKCWNLRDFSFCAFFFFFFLPYLETQDYITYKILSSHSGENKFLSCTIINEIYLVRILG